MIDRYFVDPQADYLPYSLESLTSEVYQRHGDDAHLQAVKKAVWNRMPKVTKRRGTRLAPALVALILISVLTVGAIAVRPILFNFLKETSDTLTAEFRGGPLDTQDPASTYPSLEAALTAHGLTGLSPQWIPARFSLKSVEVQQIEETTVFSAWFEGEEDADGLSVTITAYIGSNLHTQRNTFEVNGSEHIIQAGGVSHYVDKNYEMQTAQWEYGNCLCSIRGTVSEQELEKIIASIYE